MKRTNLAFNSINFDFPKEKKQFYFSETYQAGSSKIHKSIFPTNIRTILPDAEDFIYTSFDRKKENSKELEIDFQTENQDFIKRYYDAKINFYFRHIKHQIVKKGFIRENQIWVENIALSNAQFKVYHKYTLKIQFAKISKFPELIISYDGISRVFKQSAKELIPKLSASNFNWVVYENKLIRWGHEREDKNPDYSSYYPVLNKKIVEALNLEIGFSIEKNRYINYWKLIQNFYSTFLQTNEFKALLSIHDKGFIEVAQESIHCTSKNSNLLQFKENSSIEAFDGIKKYKPYASSPHDSIHLFYIFHADDLENTKTIDKTLKGEKQFFRGLHQFVNLMFYTEDGFSILFTNKENPIEEIEKKLQERHFRETVKYIAIYVTPYGKFEKEKQNREIYYQVKELLLKRGIPSQVIDPTNLEKLGDKWFYSMPNIAVAMLAKMGGIPWRLEVPLKNELVIGVGAFKQYEEQIQYIGSAFCFSNLGKFNGFEYFRKNEVHLLAGKIAHAVRTFATENEKPERLIIHFYKSMSEWELQHIENALFNLQLEIPVFIVSINKTESEDIVAFDLGWQAMMPLSGTYIQIGDRNYLLFNNTRYSDALIGAQDGYHFPLKLKFDCTNKELLDNEQTIHELMDQIYQFSRMYWKSVRQQNLPVTIKYPEIIAQMAPHFVGDDIPEYGKRSLWFL